MVANDRCMTLERRCSCPVNFRSTYSGLMVENLPMAGMNSEYWKVHCLTSTLNRNGHVWEISFSSGVV